MHTETGRPQALEIIDELIGEKDQAGLLQGTYLIFSSCVIPARLTGSIFSIFSAAAKALG